MNLHDYHLMHWEKNAMTFRWRAVDRNGNFFYYSEKPVTTSVNVWLVSNGVCTEAKSLNANWAIENWRQTLQQYDDYLNLKNQQP